MNATTAANTNAAPVNANMKEETMNAAVTPLQTAVNAANAGMSGKVAAAVANGKNAPAAAPTKAHKPTRNAWNDEDNRVSGCAFLNARVEQFVTRHENVVSATANTYVRHTPKNGDQWHVELIVTTSVTRGRVHVDCGKSPNSIDWAKVDARFVKNLDKLIVKERDEHNGVKTPRKSSQTRAALREELAAANARADAAAANANASAAMLNMIMGALESQGVDVAAIIAAANAAAANAAA